MDKPVSAILRENKLLREVASKAIRLRHMGRLSEEIDAAYDEMVENSNGQLGRSLTTRLAHELAFQTAMEAFDEAVLRSAEAGMDWANEWLKPADYNGPWPERE